MRACKRFKYSTPLSFFPLQMSVWLSLRLFSNNFRWTFLIVKFRFENIYIDKPSLMAHQSHIYSHIQFELCSSLALYTRAQCTWRMGWNHVLYWPNVVGHSWLNEQTARNHYNQHMFVQYNFGHNSLSKNRLDTNIPHWYSYLLSIIIFHIEVEWFGPQRTPVSSSSSHNLFWWCHILIRLRLSFCNIILVKMYAGSSFSNSFDRDN